MKERTLNGYQKFAIAYSAIALIYSIGICAYYALTVHKIKKSIKL